MYKFKFADIGEGLHEGTVGEIYLKVGDSVKEGESLFEVETDKVTSDIPSPTTGKITKILIKTGETVTVGDEIFYIDDGSASDSTPAAEPQKAEAKEESVSEGGASVVGSIEVSNKLFSFDAFKKKAESKNSQEVPQKSQPAKMSANGISASSKAKLPNPSKVKAIGNGEQVDVVIIGAGPGGYDIAERLGKMKFKVVSIEDRFAGGVCLNIGCIPTKTLLKGAKVYNHMGHGDELGIDVDMSKVKINWARMQQRKVEVSKKLEKGVEMLLRASGVEFIKGRAEVIDRYNVKVDGRVFTTKYIIVASGSSPILLEKMPGFADALKKGDIVDSTGALEFKKIPKSLAIVGGGVIGVEFATLYNEFGSEVTILEGQDTILGPMDSEVKKVAHKLLESNGIKIKTGVKVIGYENGSVLFEENGKKGKLKTEKTLVSVGRKANNLGLDKTIGLKLDPRGAIEVNDIMQTSVDNVFAIGDVIGQVMLAHAAYKHASVLQSAFQGYDRPYNKYHIPGVVYIYPEISSIGKTEDELKAEGTEYLVSSWKNIAVGRALAENDTVGFTKLLFDPKYGRILGAHIINYSSSEMITEIGAVMELEGTVFELAATVHPHPSSSEGIYEAATHAVEKMNKRRK